MKRARRGRLPWLTPSRRPLAGGLLTAGAGQLVLIVSGVLVARALGPEDRGFLALVVLVPTILAQVGNLGVPLAATYYVARDPARARSLAVSVARVAGAQAAAVFCVQLVLVWAIFAGEPSRVEVAGLISLAALPGILAQQYGLAFLQGRQRFAAFNILRLAPVTVYALGVVLVVVFDVDGLVEIATAWVTAQLAIGVITLAVSIRNLPRTPAETSVPSLSRLVRFGLKGLLGYVSPVETFRLDQAIIGLFLTPAALGLYVVSLAFTNLPRFMAQSIGMVAYPKVASTNDPELARRQVWRYFALGALLTGVVVAVLEVLAGGLVTLFFGDSFAGATSITRILLVGTFFVGLRRLLADGARGAGYPGLGTIAELASWLSFLPALAILLPSYGVEGVAAALSFAWAFSLLVLVASLIGAGRRRNGPLVAGRAVQNA
jgi:O-antigen/teichoic acid export membrane protein